MIIQTLQVYKVFCCQEDNEFGNPICSVAFY